MPAIARSLGQQFGQQFGQLGQLFAAHCEALDRERCHQTPLCFLGSHPRRSRLGRVLGRFYGCFDRYVLQTRFGRFGLRDCQTFLNIYDEILAKRFLNLMFKMYLSNFGSAHVYKKKKLGIDPEEL